MNGIKDAVFKDKNIWLLGKNQYTSNVEAGSTRREIENKMRKRSIKLKI